MEKRDGEKNGRVGKKEYKGWKRVEKGAKEGERRMGSR